MSDTTTLPARMPHALRHDTEVITEVDKALHCYACNKRTMHDVSIHVSFYRSQFSVFTSCKECELASYSASDLDVGFQEL
jgi:hypothetical protein